MDNFYEIALLSLQLQPLTVNKIVDYFGSAENFFKAETYDLREVHLNPDWMSSNYREEAFREAEKELKFIRDKNISVLRRGTPAYPRRLDQCCDAPLLLFTCGTLDLNARRIVSVVGTRHITDVGRVAVDAFITDLSRAVPDVLVVSGLAYGVDVASHRACLEKSLSTAGVVAHGLSTIYPAAHRCVAKQMVLNRGGVVTEFLSGVTCKQHYFLQRNRIIAGLADATVVVESAVRGGSLNTARLAFDYNRPVFAFAGRYGDVFSEGCNKLIANNVAQIYTGVDDMMSVLGWQKEEKVVQPTLFSELSEEEAVLSKVLSREPMHIDQIAAQVDWSMSKLQSVLTSMVFSDYVLQLPGNRYVLVPK